MEKSDERPVKKRHYAKTILLCATGAALLWYGGSIRLNERIPNFFKKTGETVYSAVTTDIAEAGAEYLNKLEKTKDISAYEQQIADVASRALNRISLEHGKTIALDYLVQNSEKVQPGEAYAMINAFRPALNDSQKTELSIEVYKNIDDYGQKLEVFKAVGSDVLRSSANYLGDKTKEAGQNIKDWIKRK